MSGSIKQFTARTCLVFLFCMPLALIEESCKAARHWWSDITLLLHPCLPSVFPLKIGSVHKIHHDNCCHPPGKIKTVPLLTEVIQMKYIAGDIYVCLFSFFESTKSTNLLGITLKLPPSLGNCGCDHKSSLNFITQI